MPRDRDRRVRSRPPPPPRPEDVAPLDVDAFARRAAAWSFAPTSVDRLVYPPTRERGALLKAHVMEHYVEVARWMLPHVAGRPLVFRRYPHGIEGDFFYTKEWDEGELPASGVASVQVWATSRQAPMRYATVTSAEGLAWVAQTGAVEVNPWLSSVGEAPDACGEAHGLRTRACALDLPDVLAFDLDPYVRAKATGVKGREAGGEPGLDPHDWARAVEVALALRDVLRSLRMPSFVKTSGKRGLHVHVPIVPELSYDEVRAAARTLSEHLARERPDLVTLSYDLQERKGRVFLDYNQNARGKTLAAPYSLRPTPEATVSAPLEWDELESADPAELHYGTIRARLASRGDPWARIRDARVRLTAFLGGARAAAGDERDERAGA